MKVLKGMRKEDKDGGMVLVSIRGLFLEIIIKREKRVKLWRNFEFKKREVERVYVV